MSYFSSNNHSLEILWKSEYCQRQIQPPLSVNENYIIEAPVMDIHTAANIGIYDILYHTSICDATRLFRKNFNGWTPLMFACYNGHEDIVQLLVSCGAYKSDRNHAGQIPLMLAALTGNAHLLELTYEDYVINMTDGRGWSALFHAVSRRQENAVKFLLRHGSDVNIVSWDRGHTALMTAAATGKISIVKLLLEAGCNPSYISWQGETALSIAHCFGFFDIVRLLSSSTRINELPLMDLQSLFSSLQLVHYWPLFQRHNIDLEKFFSLTEQNLKDIGVIRLGPRRKMALTILNWQKHRHHHIRKV